MPLIIRCATSADARMISEVICESWKSAYRDIIPPAELNARTDADAREQFFSRLLTADTDGFLIAFDNDKPCGICSIRKSSDIGFDGWGEVVAIYTLEAYWGHGVGRVLMDMAIAKLAELGFNRVMLWTFEKNMRARCFYESYGFTFDGARKDSGICGIPEIRYKMEVKNEQRL